MTRCSRPRSLPVKRTRSPEAIDIGEPISVTRARTADVQRLGALVERVAGAAIGGRAIIRAKSNA
jgi:hypothetical protein